MLAFARFIGDPYDDKRTFIVDVDKEWVRDLIDKINGPYGDTILKMLEIRRED